MIINVIYDASANSAPAAFKAAIAYVVNLFEVTFTDAVTINIDVGWGEVGGQALGGALGASIRNVAPAFTYGQIHNALNQDATSSTDGSAVANLPTLDPTNGGNFDIGTADAKALGLIDPNGSGIDGWIGFTSNPGTFTFDPNNRAVAGLYDFIGVAIHEISEVMGRVAWLGNTIDYPHAYSTLDLFRYSAAGVHQLTGGAQAYFSIDGGTTHLDSFNANAGGDFGDWAASAGHDAFLAFSSPGVENDLTAADIAVLDAIGWNTTAASAPKTSVTSVAISGTGITNGNGDVFAGAHLTLTVTMSGSVTVSSGTPTLTLDDGGIATYTTGSGTATLQFSYVVAAGENTTDLHVLNFNANGATITDSIGTSADLSGVAVNPTGILQVDTTRPAVVSVATSGPGISNGNGDLDAGTTVSLTINFSEVVNVAGGAPTLSLNDGGTATYASGSGSNKLVFNYTVTANQNTPDLQVTGSSLNGATLSDGAGNIADLSGAVTNPSGTLQIDTRSPSLTSINDTPATGSLVPGTPISVSLKFDEAVFVSGTPTLALNDGGMATYQGGSGTSALVFNYVVGAHDNNVAELLVNAINASSASIHDGAGNSAVLTLTSAVQNGPIIHATDPIVTQILSSLPAGAVSPGTLEQITLKLNEAVTVNGSPTLILNDGGIAIYDAHVSTPTSLTFDYIVGANDQTTNLAIAKVDLSATTIKDAIGLDLSFANATNGNGLGLHIGTITNGTVTVAAGQAVYALGTNLTFDGVEHDAFTLSGARADYSIDVNPDHSITITDHVANRDFAHLLNNIESLQFTDKDVFIEQADGANIARLYSAALARAPDFGGLSAWEDAYTQYVPPLAKAQGVYFSLAEAPVGGLSSLADGFVSSSEFQQKYGALDNAQFITQLYHNVLDRDPDVAGLNGWLSAMQGGATRAVVLVGFAESPENIAKAAADWLIAI